MNAQDQNLPARVDTPASSNGGATAGTVDPVPHDDFIAALQAMADYVNHARELLASERDAMRRRAEAAESDWQAVEIERNELLAALKAYRGNACGCTELRCSLCRQADAAIASVEVK